MFTNSYLPRQNGIAHDVSLLKLGLERLGHEVFVAAPKYSRSKTIKNGVLRFPSIRLPEEFGELHYPIAIPRSSKIERFIADLMPDIIHTHQPYILGQLGLKLAKKLGCPVVLTLHTPHHDYFKIREGLLYRVGEGAMKKRLVSYANSTDQIICIAKGLKKTLRGFGVFKPIEVIPSGIDVKKFSGGKKFNLRKIFGLPARSKILLCVSRLTYEKNVPFLVRMFRHLADNPLLYLVIVGDGINRLDVEQEVKKFSLQGRIILTGKISHDELPGYYRGADVFVYSSLVEAQGLVLLEAMASGLPVVALRKSFGPREYVKHGRTGFLISADEIAFAKKVLELLKNPQLRGALGRQARSEMKKYDYRRTAVATEKVYRRVLGF